MDRRLSWVDRVLYALIFLVLLIVLFGVDTSFRPHAGPPEFPDFDAEVPAR